MEPKPARSCGMRSMFISEISPDALLQHGDARVDDLLTLLGRLVFGVLAQIAKLARPLDLLGQVDLQLALERMRFRR